MSNESIDPLATPLRVCYGLVPIIAGADKFTNLLTDWTQYLPQFVPQALSISPQAFMSIVGVVEIIAGVVVLSRFAQLGAYVVALWLVLVAGAVALAGYYDIAVRDLVMALGAYTLARLIALRGDATVSAPHSHAAPRATVAASHA